MTDRNSKGQFLPGSPGRPKGSRNRLQADFIYALAKDFEEHGEGVIRIVRAEEPTQYLKIVASILPKEFVFENALAEVGDDQVEEVLAAIRARLIAAKSEDKPTDKPADKQVH
jgi:hypothetical protein